MFILRAAFALPSRYIGFVKLAKDYWYTYVFLNQSVLITDHFLGGKLHLLSLLDCLVYVFPKYTRESSDLRLRYKFLLNLSNHKRISVGRRKQQIASFHQDLLVYHEFDNQMQNVNIRSWLDPICFDNSFHRLLDADL